MILEELEQRFLPSATYYVSPAGRDDASGASGGAAWRTINRVNSERFLPGDTILFEGGATFDGQLVFGPEAGGTSDRPIRLGSYGDGRATINGGNGNAFSAEETAGITLSNLNFVGSGAANIGDGIYFGNGLNGDVVLDHIYVDHVEVSGFGYAGIHIVSGDLSGFRDVRITDSSLHDNAVSGLDINGLWDGHSAYGMHNVYVGHVQTYDNMGRRDYGSYSGSGMVLGGIDGGVIERSVAYHNGAAAGFQAAGGIWTYASRNLTLQFNESYNNVDPLSFPTDGNGILFDVATIDSVMQYNYSHDNDGVGLGLVGDWEGLAVNRNRNNTIRYNISQNDGRRQLGSLGVYGDVESADIYNNTIYTTPRPSSAVNPAAVQIYLDWGGQRGDDIRLHNNIFETSGDIPLAMLGDNFGVVFQGNDYYSTDGHFRILDGGDTYTRLGDWQAATGQERMDGRNVGLDIDPLLNDPGSGGVIGDADQLASLRAYQLRGLSPMAYAGLDLWTLFGIDSGSQDFYGNALSYERGTWYGIGAHQIEKPVFGVIRLSPRIEEIGLPPQIEEINLPPLIGVSDRPPRTGVTDLPPQLQSYDAGPETNAPTEPIEGLFGNPPEFRWDVRGP